MRAYPGRRAARAAPALAALVVVLCVLFSGGANTARQGAGAGDNEAHLVVIGIVGLLATGLLATLALAGRAPLPSLGRAGVWFLAGTAGLAVWASLSLVWSIQADRSWDYANITLLYAALGVLGVLAGSVGAWATRVIAGSLVAALGAAIAWALAGKVVPALDPLGDHTGRLTGTVGYWNAFALLTAAALPLALWLSSSKRFGPRMAALLLVYGSTVALLLTFSRGGLLAAGVAVGTWLLLVKTRLESLAALAIGGLPALAVAGIAFALPGISSDRQPRSVRVDDGLVFGLALLAGAALVVAVTVVLTRRQVRLSPDRRRLVERSLLIAVPVAVALSVAVAVAGSSGPLTIHAGPGRFFRFGSSDRWQWWTEAVDIFRDRPVAGSGAGTFQLARGPYATGQAEAIEPHNVPLQFLSELGLVGFALFGLMLTAGVAVVWDAVRRLPGEDGLAARALAAVGAAYLFHLLVEFDWDFIALTAPVVLIVGVLAAAGRPAHTGRPRLLPAAAAGLLAVAAAFSLVTPWAADRRLESARAALAADDLSGAAAAAEDAHAINPLSVEALLVWALAEDFLGNNGRAGELYREATGLQPENPRAWRARGIFELETLMSPALARASFARARELDPTDQAIADLLEQVTGQG